VETYRERSLHLGLLEVVWGLAGGTGPLIGGAFTQYISWRSVCPRIFLFFFFLDI